MRQQIQINLRSQKSFPFIFARSDKGGGGVTRETCAHTGSWLGQGGDITVVDTPGFGNTLEEEEESIEELVDFLKDDLSFVNVFVITLKETEKRVTRGLRSMMKLLGRMFGEQMWSHSILCATHWSYGRRHTAVRTISGYGEEDWTGQVNKLLTDHPHQLQAVFIDTFYDVDYSSAAQQKFIENTNKLLQFAREKHQPFECKDIEKAVLEIREQQLGMLELTKLVETVENEKNMLMEKLQQMEGKKSSTSLMVKKDLPELTHSTTFLIIVSLIILFIGLVLGGGLNVWYTHNCIMVRGG